MSAEEIFVVSLGVEGGGFDLFVRPDGTFVEKGDSGGFLDEEEEAQFVTKWEKTYDSLDSFWAEFTDKNANFWYYFHVIKLNPDYKDALRDLALGSLENATFYEGESGKMAELINKWQLESSRF